MTTESRRIVVEINRQNRYATKVSHSIHRSRTPVERMELVKMSSQDMQAIEHRFGLHINNFDLYPLLLAYPTQSSDRLASLLSTVLEFGAAHQMDSFFYVPSLGRMVDVFGQVWTVRYVHHQPTADIKLTKKIWAMRAMAS